MPTQISLDDLRNALSQLVGIERAQDLVAEAVAAVSLPAKPTYERDEFRAICAKLKEQGGIIGVMTSAIAVRLLTG